MHPSFRAAGDLIRKAYILARPYGRQRLAIVLCFSLAQGIFQVLGVTSIFPFLALAADPARMRNSPFGREILSCFPPMDDARLLLIAGAFAVGMLLLSNGVNLLAEFVRTRYAHQFGHWLRCLLLRKIATRPYGDFLQQNSGVLVKKVVGDVMGYVTGVLLPLLDSLARIATIVLLVGTLFLVHPQIAIFATAGLSFFYLIIFRIFGNWRTTASESMRHAGRGAFIEVQQMFGAIKTVKVHSTEEFFIERFTKHSAVQARLFAWASILSNGPRYLIEPIAFGGVVIAVLVYAGRGQDLSVILPNLGVMAVAGYRLLPALQLLYGQVTGLTTQRHTLQEVYDEFLAAEHILEKCTDPHTGTLTRSQALRWNHEICLEDLSFQYPGAKTPVIANLNLRIAKNSSLGIVGQTGCGKSTLVDLILGLHVPTAGRILIDSTLLGPHNHRAWRVCIGYVPQEIFLIDDSIAANIAFGIPEAEIDRAALLRAAKSAQILDFIEHELPKGFGTIVGERGVRLSGGQRQRIGLARALYHEPELLVLDEATSALDSETEDGVMHAISALGGSITMIVIAHRLRTLEMCEQRLDLSRSRPEGRKLTPVAP